MSLDPGLCGSCGHARVVGNRRGSRFWLCGLAKSDPRFRRYPAIPVLACPGYRPADPDDDESDQGDDEE